MCIYNGEQYNSDTARLIRKYDIYVCDLGDFEDGLLGKERPCVIVKNDDEISPKTGHYLVAPIRTEHQMEVTKDTLETVVNYRRQVGRLYVPIEMNAGDYRFIDVSQLRTVTSTKVQRYIGSVINRKVRNQINLAMAMLQFSDEELAFIFHERFTTNSVEPVVNIPDTKESEYHNTNTQEPPAPLSIESDTEMGKKLKEALAKQPNINVNEEKFKELYGKVKRKEIAKSSAAQKLGITIKTFEKIAKELDKEKKEEKKVKRTRAKRGTYNGFSIYLKMYEEKKITVKEIAEKYGVTEAAIRTQIRDYRKKQKELENSTVNTYDEVGKETVTC